MVDVDDASEPATAAPAETLRSFQDALVAAAMAKAGLVWLRTDATGRTYPAWHVWDGTSAYLVHQVAEPLAGDQDEQQIPALAENPTVEVIVKGSRGGRTITWVAQAAHPTVGSPEWLAALELLRTSRLNAVDQTNTDHANSGPVETEPDGLKQRWARGCRIAVLTPTGVTPETPGSYDQRDHSAAVPESPATTVTAKPFVLGRRARRRPKL